jgi:aminopeptidase-like protein
MKSTALRFDDELQVGRFCHDFATKLFPICRSITGDGIRLTLQNIGEHIPALVVHSVPSGTKCFDWAVPPEWNITEAYIEDESGRRVVDFADHNLHVVGYSTPVDDWLDLEDLQPHLYSLPAQPDAIPYVTSYYASRWGFCLSERQRSALRPGRYHVVIRSSLEPGQLNYGEALIEGETSDEVLLSTYCCHPSMGNNELSGPVVTTALALYLQSLPRRRLSYRIVFVPETIGAIVFLSRAAEALKSRVIAGFNINCVGDERCYSYLPSRAGDTVADQAARHVLTHLDPTFRSYSWLQRGSDERQYCAPGIDLPVCSVMRSKYGEYPEYHTSLDDLSLITPAGLGGGFKAHRQIIEALEHNIRPKVTVLGEPQLGKRGLYPTLSTSETKAQVQAMMDLISYADGSLTLLEIAERIEQPIGRLITILESLEREGLIERV